MELCSYLVIVAVGHQDRRRGYPFNRQISGYTVFKNTPHFNMGSSTIKLEETDPEAQLDAYGFLTDFTLTPEKKPNTIRIFVVGGSTAFGAGQNSSYHDTHFYPDGVYSYPRSIAGQLKIHLERSLPDARFEVINAAAYGRRFHHSMVLYLELISTLSPDYVVNIEGWNDISTFLDGEPFKNGESLLPEFVDMKVKSESWLNRSNTFYVLSTAFDKYGFSLTRSRPSGDHPASYDTAQRRDEQYAKHRDTYIANAVRFEQLLKQYMAVLKVDETRLIFVLQPMLHRTQANKTLSSTEKKLFEVNVLDESMSIASHFFDDYLTARLQVCIAENGETYIDANHEMRQISSEVEVFTDYCHLTPAGNRILAEIVGEQILLDHQSD
jgi:hypothetical protein